MKILALLRGIAEIVFVVSQIPTVDRMIERKKRQLQQTLTKRIGGKTNGNKP